MLDLLLIYVCPAVLMILLVQVIRNCFVCDDGTTPIKNGYRWILIIIAMVPVVNVIFLCFLLIAIVLSISCDSIKPIDGSKFFKWWNK